MVDSTASSSHQASIASEAVQEHHGVSPGQQVCSSVGGNVGSQPMGSTLVEPSLRSTVGTSVSINAVTSGGEYF